MSLRDDLAGRLLVLFYHPPDDLRPESWSNVVDECIRQMEWARSRQYTQLATTHDGKPTMIIQPGDWGTSWHTKTLTLAPKDWKP